MLSPCPDTPNCVSSDSREGRHHVDPLRYDINPEKVWPAVIDAVRAMSGVSIVTLGEHHVHAECRIPFFGFVDDLELEMRPIEHIVAVRSASRVGRWDLGVNRRRVERLRRRLLAAGIITAD